MSKPVSTEGAALAVIKKASKRKITISTHDGIELDLNSPKIEAAEGIRAKFEGQTLEGNTLALLAEAFQLCTPEGVTLKLAKEFIIANGGEGGEAARAAADLCGFGGGLQDALARVGGANLPT